MKTIAPLTTEDVHKMHSWSYEGDLSMYSFAYIPIEKAIAFFLDPENGYFGIYGESGELEGFCNFGSDARVADGDYSTEAVDVGIGLRPNLVGRGLGTGYAKIVFEEARKRFPGLPLRVTIAAFNKASIRVCEKNGFTITHRFTRKNDGMDYVTLSAS